jgi:hypothetical protein
LTERLTSFPPTLCFDLARTRETWHQVLAAAGDSGRYIRLFLIGARCDVPLPETNDARRCSS